MDTNSNKAKPIHRQPSVLIELTPAGDPKRIIPASTDEREQLAIQRFCDRYLHPQFPGEGRRLSLVRRAA